MNPYYPLPIATAPYCREARVTFAWQQTACGMRHCCARRIVETGSRRKLGCTSTRWAERHPQGVYRIRKAAKPPTAAQQRIIGAEANRLATPNAATPRAGSRIPEAQRSFKLWTANLSLSLGVPKGPFSFAKENGPFDSPPARCRDRSSPFGLQNPRALWARNPSSAATLESAQKKEHPCGCSFSSLS